MTYTIDPSWGREAIIRFSGLTVNGNTVSSVNSDVPITVTAGVGSVASFNIQHFSLGVTTVNTYEVRFSMCTPPGLYIVFETCLNNLVEWSEPPLLTAP
jgi:hypothetical protein